MTEASRYTGLVHDDDMARCETAITTTLTLTAVVAGSAVCVILYLIVLHAYLCEWTAICLVYPLVSLSILVVNTRFRNERNVAL